MKKLTIYSLIFVLVLFGLIQLVPYGKTHTNPPVIQEPAWPTLETRNLAKRACFDCHSNETVWLWYSNIAPMSWLIQRDVDEGRQKLNFSEWGVGPRGTEGFERLVSSVQEGEMPPLIYIPIHPSANLNKTEKQTLIQGLEQIPGVGTGGEGGGEGN